MRHQKHLPEEVQHRPNYSVLGQQHQVAAKEENVGNIPKAISPIRAIRLKDRRFHPHFQRRRAAFPRGPVQLRLRAQKDLRRFAAFDPGVTLPVTGACRLLPVARLYLARPLAVRPPPALTLSFSPRPTLRFGPFFRFRAAIGWFLRLSFRLPARIARHLGRDTW